MINRLRNKFDGRELPSLLLNIPEDWKGFVGNVQ